jgi:hypothetical protein
LSPSTSSGQAEIYKVIWDIKDLQSKIPDNYFSFQEEIVLKTCKCTQGRLLLTAFVIFCLSICSVQAYAACPSADLTGDYFVDFKGIDALSAQWLSGTPSDCATSNLTGDCFVGLDDFAAQWLFCGNPFDAEWCER